MIKKKLDDAAKGAYVYIVEATLIEELPMTKATLKRSTDPMDKIKQSQGIVPTKWVILIGDDPFSYYTTNAEAVADAKKFDLDLR